MTTGGARGAISVPSLSVALAALATAPLWTTTPTPAGIAVAVLVALATAALAAHTAPAAPAAVERPAAEPVSAPADHTRVPLAQFTAGVRGSRAPPVASA
jgi:hypothetical protein